MKIKVFLGLLLIQSVSFSQDTEKIRLNVRVINSVDGAEIKNATVKMSYSLSENVISPKTEKKVSFYEVVKGADIKVLAEAFQFYPEEKRFETDRLFDDDVLEVRLNPRPAGSAIIAVIDAKSKQPVPASVEISFGGSKNSQSTSQNKQELEIYYERNGLYTLTASAPGYDTKELKEDLKINGALKKVTIELNKTLSAQQLVFKDKTNKDLVLKPTVEITSATGQNVAWNSAKGEFATLPGENYAVKAILEGYNNFQAQVKADNRPIELFLEAKSLAPFVMKIQDMITLSNVLSEIDITTPSGLKEKASTRSPYTPKEKGEYTFEFNSPEMGSHTVKAVTAFIQDKKEIPVNFEVRSKITLKIVVLDSISKQPIPDVTIRAFNEKSNEIQGNQERNSKSFKISSLERIFYEVSAPGYPERTGNTGATGDVSFKTTTVYLNKKVIENFQEHEYTFVDAHTKEPILRTQIIILDHNKKAVETLFNAAKGTYLTYKIDPSKTYTLQAKSLGYKDLNESLKSGSRNITIEMEPSDLEEVVISVYDEYTREMLILNNLSITSSSGKNVDFTERNREYVATLNRKAAYKLKFKTGEYPAVDKEYKLEDYQNNKIDIFVRKTLYPLSLNIQNDLTQEQKNQATSVISYLSGSQINSRFDKDKKAFLVDSDPNETLQVEINVPGFRLYKASNNRKQLAQYEIKVMLEPIPEAAPEIVKEEVAKVEEPKVEEPKVVKVEAPKEVAKVEESEVKKEVPVKTDEPMVAAKGKRYPLTGVNFEQSKTTMLYGSELKLKELLDFMNNNPKVKIEVIGHTDKVGDERQNKRLSEFRARTVANWLFNKGINPERIITTGKGSAENIAANDSEETKAQNRRIEVLVIDD